MPKAGVTGDGSLFNILVPTQEDTAISKLVRKVQPKDCEICQL